MLKTFLSVFLSLLADERGELDLTALGEEMKSFTRETASRLLAIEQKITAPGGGAGFEPPCTAGDLLIESEGFKAVQQGARKSSGSIQVKSFHHKTAVVNSTGAHSHWWLPTAFRGYYFQQPNA